MKEKVVLAYSGGLDTTAVIPWLKETFGYDVICGDRNVPIARGAWQMWRVNFSKSDTMRWQLRLPAHSCDFESNNHIFDRKGDHLWKN